MHLGNAAWCCNGFESSLRNVHSYLSGTNASKHNGQKGADILKHSGSVSQSQRQNEANQDQFWKSCKSLLTHPACSLSLSLLPPLSFFPLGKPRLTFDAIQLKRGKKFFLFCTSSSNCYKKGFETKSIFYSFSNSLPDYWGFSLNSMKVWLILLNWISQNCQLSWNDRIHRLILQ